MVKEDMQEVGVREDEVCGQSVWRKHHGESRKTKILTRKTFPTPSRVLDQEHI